MVAMCGAGRGNLTTWQRHGWEARCNDLQHQGSVGIGRQGGSRDFSHASLCAGRLKLYDRLCIHGFGGVHAADVHLQAQPFIFAQAADCAFEQGHSQ